MAEVKKVSVNTDEEALIKKRLLTQTTTARPGADPPVKKLTKKYVAYVNALAEDDANGDGADAERAREAWLKEIALYEFNMGRYRAVASANAREMEQYASASAAVDGEVRGTKDEIAELKTDLDGARLDRQHKEEYEALRRLCTQFPSRSDTTARLASLEAEIAELETESEATASKLDLRKKQFALLLHLVNELQGELAEEAAEEAAVAQQQAAHELEEGEMEDGEMEEGEMEDLGKRAEVQQKLRPDAFLVQDHCCASSCGGGGSAKSCASCAGGGLGIGHAVGAGVGKVAAEAEGIRHQSRLRRDLSWG